MLLDLNSLAVTAVQAAKIKECFDQLHEFDKKPLRFEPKTKKSGRSRFARTKDTRSGQPDVAAMKRYC